MTKVARWLLVATLTMALPVAAQETEFTQLAGERSLDAAVELLEQADAGSRTRLVDPVELPAPSEAAQAPRRQAAGSGAAKSSDITLSGSYLFTYTTLTEPYTGNLDEVTVAAVEGTDSVTITGFWDSSYEVKALVDLTSMTVTIPNQVVGYSSTYGDMDLAVYSTSGGIDRTSPITATIRSDGSVIFDCDWGIFPATSTTKTFGIYTDGRLVAPNGTMSQTSYDTSTLSYSTTTYKVGISQPAAKTLEISNFANGGMVVTIKLRQDSTATISRQLALTNSTAYWYTYRCTYRDDMSGIDTYSYTIYCDQATDARTVSWGDWTMISGSGVYAYAYFTNGTITADFDLAYPTASGITFDGEGTEASPYLIKTADDLDALASAVNYSTDYSLTSDSTTAIVYRGSYFRLENDIDMSGVDFDPIGFDTYHRFDGTFDGDGHTIYNLSVNTGSLGYAGLFGRLGSYSAIKGITLDSPSIASMSSYAGAIAAYSTGTIDSCHVVGGQVTNEWMGAAGIAAVAASVTGCSVTGATIAGYYGYAAGIVGQATGDVTGCAVTGVSISTKNGSYSTTYPAGGVVAYATYSTISQCYFSGDIQQVDLDEEQYAMYIGGVVGQMLNGTISQCFSTGSMTNLYSSVPSFGGIVGYMGGTVENCYSTMNIDRTTYGGIAGYIRYYYDSDKKVQTTVIRDCWHASTSATTYGQLSGNALIQVENCYYDRQLASASSTDTAGCYTAQMTTADGLESLDSSVWTFTQGYYPRLAALADNEAAYLSASVIELDSANTASRVSKDATLALLGSTTASTTGTCSSVSGSTFAVSGDAGTDTLYFTNPTAGARSITLKIAPVSFDGSGTEDDPYLIRTKSDLIELSTATTTSGQLFSGIYFQMTNDIDMELDEDFIGICTSSTSSNRFSGTFDGAGYTIHNLKMSAVVWSTEPDPDSGTVGTPNATKSSKYIAFIGKLADVGTLKRLTLAADCQFDQMWTYCAPLVGRNFGTIDSCRNYADFTSYGNYCGGISGDNYSTGVISNCYNEGNVTVGGYETGGITSNNKGLIQNCQNCGDVKATHLSTYVEDEDDFNWVGGIAGYMEGGRIENCVNTGSVTGYYRVGGIVGYTGTTKSGTYSTEVVNCLSYGAIFPGDADQCGNIGGRTTSVSTDNYYDGQITLYGAVSNTTADGVTAATTATLTSGTALSGYSTDLWDFSAGLYPVLAQFASENKSATARGMIATIDPSQTVADIYSVVELSTADDCSWSLADGSAFIITGSTLYPPATVTTTVTDTLTATAGDVTKRIVIQAATSSGVEAAAGAGRQIVDETYYTTDGRKVESPSGQKAIYIVRRTYDDNSTETTKLAR